jgi:hypothetical protein
LFISDFQNELENAKYSLDIRSKVNEINSYQIIKSFLSIKSDGSPQPLPDNYYSNFLPKFDIAYVLNLFGFDKENVELYYTSTKCWMHLLDSIKETSTFHSLKMFDLNLNEFQNDKDPSRLLKLNLNKFEINKNVSKNSISYIKSINTKDMNNIIDLTNSIYENLYRDLNSRDEESKISSIINNVTKIFKYSISLNKKNIKNLLNDSFNYQIDNNGNLNFLDYVYGSLNESILDAGSNNRSLLGISHSTESGRTILNLEPQDLQGNLINVKSGGERNIESILDLNQDNSRFYVDNANIFLQTLSRLDKNYSDFVNLMDFFDLKQNFINESNSFEKNELETTNSLLMFNDIESMFFNGDVLNNQSKNDSLVPVLSLCSQNTTLKTLLFLYYAINTSVINQEFDVQNLTKNNSSKAEKTTYILSRIEDELKKISIKNKFGIVPSNSRNTLANNKISINEILSSIQNGSLSKNISLYFDKILSVLKTSGGLNSENKSLYGNYTDSILLMSIFDVIVKYINSFSSKKIIDKLVEKNEIKFLFGIFDKNITSQRNEIKFRLNNENILIQHGIIACLSIIRSIKNVFNSLLNKASGQAANKSLNEIKSHFPELSYFKLFLKSENQISLLLNQLTEYFDEIKSIDEINKNDKNIVCLEQNIINDDLKSQIDNFFSLESFTNDLSKNLKIFSIGIPHNIHNRIKNKIRTDKRVQDDIVKILVYKIDSFKPELIFYPKEFLFELSRFTARKNIINEKNKLNSIDEVIANFATRDRSQVYSSNNELIQYLNSNKNESIAFNTSDYDFLSRKEKNDLYKNHVVSHILNLYIQILSGFNPNEFNLTIDNKFSKLVESEFLTKFMILHIDNFFQQNSVLKNKNANIVNSFFENISNLNFQNEKNSIYSSVNYAIQNPDTLIDSLNLNQKLQQILPKLSEGLIIQLLNQINAINDISQIKSDISNPDLLFKNINNLKIFDRVFNFIIDPQDFLLDKEKICLTNQGKVIFEKLLNSGEIIEIDNSFQLKKKQSISDIASADKYFISLEILDDNKEIL